MRGFPLVNLLLILLLLAAVVYPVMRRVTNRLDAAAPDRFSANAEPGSGGGANALTVPVLLSLRAVHAPAEVEVRLGETVIFSAKPETVPALERQMTVDLPWEENGVEFTLHLRWPQGTPDTVAEVTAAPDGHEAQRQNIWSSGGEAEEVLRFTWPEGGGL